MGTKWRQMRHLRWSISIRGTAATRGGRLVRQRNHFSILCGRTGTCNDWAIVFGNFSCDANSQEIKIEVELTANHQGHFEVYLCPNNNPLVEADQDCFDRYPLQVVGQEDHLYIIPIDSEKKGTFRCVRVTGRGEPYATNPFSNGIFLRFHRYSVQLPPYVTCTQCVLQWTYYTANMWGKCDNGTESVGCGKPGKIDFHRNRDGASGRNGKLIFVFSSLVCRCRNIPKLCWCGDNIEHRWHSTVVHWQKQSVPVVLQRCTCARRRQCISVGCAVSESNANYN